MEFNETKTYSWLAPEEEIIARGFEIDQAEELREYLMENGTIEGWEKRLDEESEFGQIIEMLKNSPRIMEMEIIQNAVWNQIINQYRSLGLYGAHALLSLLPESFVARKSSDPDFRKEVTSILRPLYTNMHEYFGLVNALGYELEIHP